MLHICIEQKQLYMGRILYIIINFMNVFNILLYYFVEVLTSTIVDLRIFHFYMHLRKYTLHLNL